MLEVLDLGKTLRHKEDPTTGLPLENEPLEESTGTEIRATGKDVRALFGEMRESAQITAHQAWNRRQLNGEEVLSSPLGKRVAVEGSLVDQYKRKGYGRLATKPMFVVNGFGGMKRAGLHRARYRYSGGVCETLLEE